jgi:hypothetical protein
MRNPAAGGRFSGESGRDKRTKWMGADPLLSLAGKPASQPRGVSAHFADTA